MPITTHATEVFRRTATIAEDERTYEIGFIVFKSDDATPTVPIEMNVQEVIDALPYELGDAFPTLEGVLLQRIRPACRNDCDIWDVTLEFEVPDFPPIPDDFGDFIDNKSQDDSPTNPFGPKFDGGGQVVEEHLAEDLDHKPVVNSAGDPLSGGLVVFTTVQVDRVTVNERNKPNTASIGLCDGKKLLANISYSSEEHVDNTTGIRTRYYSNSYEVWTHPYRDWKDDFKLDAGFREFVNEVNDWLPIRDEDTGEPVSAEVCLDGAGHKLEHGQEPKYRKFRVRKEGALNVPFLS